MLNEKEHLLVCLVEECGEVIEVLTRIQQKASKSLRFGINDRHHERTTTNLEDLRMEFSDLVAIGRKLDKHGFNLVPDEYRVAEKIQRTESYMVHARETGALRNDKTYAILIRGKDVPDEMFMQVNDTEKFVKFESKMVAIDALRWLMTRNSNLEYFLFESCDGFEDMRDQYLIATKYPGRDADILIHPRGEHKSLVFTSAKHCKDVVETLKSSFPKQKVQVFRRSLWSI